MKAELLAYGEVVSNEYAKMYEGWYGEDVSNLFIFPQKFNDVINELNEGDELNVFFNSPGGDVFEAVSISSQIKRARMRGVTVNAYIDGLAASAASFLVMACDNVYAYTSSMMMVHKPMSVVYGNADEMRTTAQTLEDVEDATCMPLYLEKAKVPEEDIKEALTAETWLSSKSMCDMFNITLLTNVEAPNQSKTQQIMKYCAQQYHMPANFLKGAGIDPKEPTKTKQSKNKTGGTPKQEDYTAFFNAINKIKED